MKKLLIFAAVILLLVLVGIGIFIATFDINTYKGIIISTLESVTGNKVEIGRLSIKWQPSALLEVDDFKIYSISGGVREDLLSTEHADASVDLAGLLMRRLPISNISVRRPVLHIIRKKDQKIAVSGYSPGSGNSGGPSAGSGSTAPAFSINIGSVAIEDGTVRFQDMTSDPVSDITVRKIDAKVSNISMAGPLWFSANMAVSGTRQNLALSGTAGGFSSKVIYARDLDIEADLGAIDPAELAKAFPQAQKIGLSGVTGLFKAKIRKLEVSGSKVSDLSADLSLTEGSLAVTKLKVPVDRVNLSASCEGSSIDVKSFSLGLASGRFTGSGIFNDIYTYPQANLKIALEVEGVKNFLNSVVGQKQNFDGNMRLSFEGIMKGSSWPEISKTMTGGGEFYLDRGMMTNTNIMNQTLSSLTLFPGLPDIVRGYVPAPVQQTLGSDNTVIAPLRQTYEVRGGYVMIPDLKLRTDTFELRGDAKTSLTGDVSGSGVIKFARSVSDAMVKAVPEMKYMVDDQGLVEFPMAFKGGDEGFKVIPDMKYVGTKIAVQKAGEVVSEFLQKSAVRETAGTDVKQDTAAGAASGGTPSSGKPPKLKDLIKDLMKETNKTAK